MKRLSIIITIFKTKPEDVKFWISFFQKNNGKLNIFFLFDGIESHTKEFELIPTESKYIEKKNIGKFKMVMNFLKSETIKTDYFKLVDPDDRIFTNNLLTITLPERPVILTFEHIAIDEEVAAKENIGNIISNRNYIRKSNSFGNSFTILPTSFFVHDELYSGQEIRINEDQIFGLIAWFNGADWERIQSTFYIYIENIGQLNNEEIFRRNIENTLNEALSIIDKSQRKIWPNINWPMTIRGRILELKDNSKILNKWEILYKKTKEMERKNEK